jgi:hypothetical protein
MSLEKITRAPLTDDQLKKLRADDIAKLKLTQDEFYRLKSINEIKATERISRISRMTTEQKPILNDLESAGVKVNSLADLITSRKNHDGSALILLNHLQLPYSDVTRETIARALAARGSEISEFWPRIVDEYKKSKEGFGIKGPGDNEPLQLGAKSGLAATLICMVSDEKTKELIGLIKDPANGDSRVILLSPLFISKDPGIKKLLIELSSDPVLGKEILAHFKK